MCPSHTQTADWSTRPKPCAPTNSRLRDLDLCDSTSMYPAAIFFSDHIPRNCLVSLTQTIEKGHRVLSLCSNTVHIFHWFLIYIKETEGEGVGVTALDIDLHYFIWEEQEHQGVRVGGGETDRVLHLSQTSSDFLFFCRVLLSYIGWAV